MDTEINHTKDKSLWLLDISGYIFRAFYALPPISKRDGTPINAVYGLCSMINNLINTTKPQYIAAVFDTGKKNFRHKIYSKYKANRRETPTDLIAQFKIINKVPNAFCMHSFKKDNFEADDVIASIAKLAKKQGFNVIIVSSDKDLMQLIDDKTKIYDPQKRLFLNDEDVLKKFGTSPDKVLEIQALMGDNSDNIPGIPGVGPKTAQKLIKQFGSLKNVFDNLKEVENLKLREKLIKNQDLANLSYQLASLKHDIDLDISFESLKIKKNNDVLINFFKEHEFNSLIARINRENNHLTQNFSLIEIENTSDISKIIKALTEDVAFFFNFYTDDNDIEYFLALSRYSKEVFAVNLHNINKDYLVTALAEIISDESITKIGYDLKDFFKICAKLKIKIKAFEDVKLLNYSINAGKDKNSFEKLQRIFFNSADTKELNKNLITNIVTIKLSFKELYPQLSSKRVATIYEILQKPLLPTICHIEENGILINKPLLLKLSKQNEIEKLKLQEQIFLLAGEEFNILSSKQLSKILFEKLKLRTRKKTKSGYFSTNTENLTQIIEDHPIVKLIINYRLTSKINSTFIKGILSKLNNKNIIYPNFDICATSTGRISTKAPNLQNLPSKGSSKIIRESFIAPAKNQILSLDYSQIELRITAFITQEENLIAELKMGNDLHKATASKIFNVHSDDINSYQRNIAKTINFAVLYGLSPYSLSNSIGITVQQATDFIDEYFNQFPKIKPYIEKTINYCKKHGFVRTIFGRIINVPNINHQNYVLREHAKRQSINAPIQGSAADIIIIAMNEISDYLRKNSLRSKMILQIHDELLFQISDDELSIIPKLKDIMSKAYMKLYDGDFILKVNEKLGDKWL